MSSSEQDQKPVFITKPLLNSIPDHLLPRFDPTYAEYYGKYNAGRLHTHQIPIEAYRADPMKYTISYGRALGPRVFRTTDQKCPVSGGHEINVRIYEPAEVDPDAAKRPVYINYHGGGFVFGSLAVDKDFCRRVCQEVGAVVFDVDYRLAPENPFPIPVEDCWAAFQWIREQKAKEFNLDLDRMAVGGVSAGGHLAAVTALRCRDSGIPLAFQLLSVPVTDLHAFTPTGELDPDCPYESYREMYDTVALPAERMSYFHKHFLGNPRPMEYDDESNEACWLVSPIKHRNHKDLAPALVITAEMDPLRDEGEAYGKKMNEAGSTAEIVRVKGAPHVFMYFDDILDIGKFYNKKTIEALKNGLKVVGKEAA